MFGYGAKRELFGFAILRTREMCHYNEAEKNQGIRKTHTSFCLNYIEDIISA